VSVRRPLAALVCWTLLVGLVAPPAVAGVTAPGAADPATAPLGTVASPAAVGTVGIAAANNTTVRHRNPDRRDGDGDLAAVRDHLAGEMREIVVDCSRSVGVGEFEPCEGLNGSYGDALSKYVEVSRETAGDGDDRTARSFRRTRREGREYARTVREFRETYESYREAREGGNTSRARRTARELRALAADAERTGGNLTRSLGNLTRSGTDVGPASRAVNDTTANVSRTVAGIEGDLFVATETTARANASAVSFRDPLVVTGRVTTANGTAVAGATVGLSRLLNGTVGERVRARARTNATGHYRLSYRPVTVPAGSVPVAVRLLPAAESPHLPSNATFAARIEQVRAELTVLSAPATAAYGDRLRVRVRVTTGDTAAGTPVDGLPVAAHVGEHRLGSARTDGDGEAPPGGRLPAAVPAGERTLVVGFETVDRAIAPVTESIGLDVRETGTTLSATARTENGSLAVHGRLRTVDGRRLTDRPVRVVVDGRSLGSLRTNATGAFERRLGVPDAVRPDEGAAERTVRFVFDEAGGNLGRAETTATVTLGAAAPSDAVLGDAATALALGALLLAAAGAALAVRRRSSGEGPADPPVTDRGGGPDGAAVDPATALDAVRAAMDAGDYDLVTTAGYRAVRRALADRVAAGPDATHWEFYGACAADGIDPERLEAIRGLTERFERVAFAPDGASRSVAAASLADAETVLGDAADGGGSTGATAGPTGTDAPPAADGS